MQHAGHQCCVAAVQQRPSSPDPAGGSCRDLVGQPLMSSTLTRSRRAMKLRLLVVDDNRLFRDGLAALLNTQPDLTVVAALANGEEALRRVLAVKPDVVLLDRELRNQDALNLAHSVRRTSPESKVILMGLLPIQEDVVEYVRAGVSGFVLKAATLDELLHAIRSVAQGASILPPPLTVSLFSQIADLSVRRGEGRRSRRCG